MHTILNSISHKRLHRSEEHQDKELSETERVKFLLAVSNGLVPAAKHILYKNLLTADSAAQRDCVGLVLGKLVDEDKSAKGLVKQVNL